MKLWHKQNGDTIIEVMISLAILMLVLGGAYYTASQSYRNDRDSQEHTEALTIAQSQLEELRVIGSIAANEQCIGTNLTPSNACDVNSSDTTLIGNGSQCTPYCYTVKISKVTSTSITYSVPQPPPPSAAPPVDLNTYDINVTWTAIGGTGKDSVSLYYRMDSIS